MINKPPPFKGLNIRILTIIPVKGRRFINHGSGLVGFRVQGCTGALKRGSSGCTRLIWALGFGGVAEFSQGFSWELYDPKP